MDRKNAVQIHVPRAVCHGRRGGSGRSEKNHAFESWQACPVTGAIPIEQLAEKCSFPNVAYPLLNGELPGPHELVGAGVSDRPWSLDRPSLPSEDLAPPKPNPQFAAGPQSVNPYTRFARF